MADNDTEKAAPANDGPTLVERWLEDQQEWQRTAMSYLDAMVKNDEFLVHLGNAMRGSLLAGKPYPTAPPTSATKTEAPEDDRLDRVLNTLNRLDGEIQDLRMTLEELRDLQLAALDRPEERGGGTGGKRKPGEKKRKASKAKDRNKAD